MKKLEKTVYIAYAIAILFIFTLFVYMAANIKNNIYAARQNEGYRILTPERFLTVEGASVPPGAYAPAGAYNECYFSLTDISPGNSELVFYTSHEAVEVYIGDTLVFSLRPDEKNAFSKTAGANWNTVPLYVTDEGSTLKVVLIPLYGNRLDTLPDFYLGSRLEIWMHLVGAALPTFLLGLFAIIIGCIFILFKAINIRNKDVDKSLMMMGAFSVFIGSWKVTDLSTTTLLFPSSILLAYIPYFSLMLVVIPFVMFVKEMFTDKENILWYIPCFASLAIIPVMALLQITGIYDIRESLWMVHLAMLSIIPVVIAMIIREIKKYGWSRKLKLTFLCMGGCLIGLFADVSLYYISRGETISMLGMLSFLAYIVALGITSLRDAQRLMAIGRQAKRFEEMAYHDQLTGLYNRTAYADYTNRKDFDPKNHIVVMFDLNNLKKCNDTLGHDQGDYYIITSARFINKNFGEYGHCYRMGGDEFCALLHNVPLARCIDCAEHLKRDLAEYNASHKDSFPIHIACGYQLYDVSVDYDLGDTLRRADKMMYNEKFAMKQKNNEEVR